MTVDATTVIESWNMKAFINFSLSLADENNPLSQTIPDAPTELKFFIKLCHQRKKFPVLYKIEFTVSCYTCFFNLTNNINMLVHVCDNNLSRSVMKFKISHP